MGEENTEICLITSAKGLALVHRDDYYETPPPILKDLEISTGKRINIDVSATPDNKVCHYYIGENEDALTMPWKQTFADPTVAFCNPPRSKNGKFVNKAYEEWEKGGLDIIMMLCWNDLGNKYGKKLLTHILNGSFTVEKNYGKIKFWKGGVESEYHSRLTYFSLWMKRN